MTSKLVITLEGPANFEAEAFMQMCKDLIVMLKEGYNTEHMGKMSSHYAGTWESGRVSE